MSKQTITIYGKKLCVFCDRAKALAGDIAKTRPSLEIQFIDIEEEGLTKEMLAKRLGLNSVHTVPQIMVNDNYVGGFTELRERALENNWVGTEKDLVI